MLRNLRGLGFVNPKKLLSHHWCYRRLRVVSGVLKYEVRSGSSQKFPQAPIFVKGGRRLLSSLQTSRETRCVTSVRVPKNRERNARVKVFLSNPSSGFASRRQH